MKGDRLQVLKSEGEDGWGGEERAEAAAVTVEEGGDGVAEI